MDENIIRNILEAAMAITRHDLESAKEYLRDAIELIDVSEYNVMEVE